MERKQRSARKKIARGTETPLSEYDRKRSPSATNEPFADAPFNAAAAAETLHGAFVVQLHDATRRHYDVRLEVGGVLVSFAVPRGPSLDPRERHLAVRTEEHPIEYLEFEDVIPEKQYGAGSMIVWDRGSVTYLEGPAEKELESGKLHVELRGMKLRGRWTFVKLAKSESGNEWLFFKKQDEHASTETKLVDESPQSVLSGLTVDELERKGDIGRAHVARARALGAARVKKDVLEIASLDPCPLALPQAGKPTTRSGWVYDPELDGVRVAAARDGDGVVLRRYTANGPGESIEAFYPDVVRALRALPVSRFVLDGELVAFDASGHPSLPLLAQRVEKIAKGDLHRAVTTAPVVLVATDVLALGDADARSIPLEGRRELLSKLLPRVGYVRAAQPLEGDVDIVLAACAALGVAGVVAKKKGARYAAGSDGSWLYVSSGIAPRSRATIDHLTPASATSLRRVTVSNRTKIFWPEEGYTKGDLVDYYASIADVLLPYLTRRPVILVRYPDGIEGKNFFQWNVPVGMPAWVRTLSLEDEDGNERRRGFLIDDVESLAYVANLACIPLHMLASRIPDLTQADFLTLDFDVKQSELRHAITLARTLHEVLDAIGLAGFPKTSGQTGLHVLVPLGTGQSFDTARGLADVLGRILVDRHPDIATMDRVVTRRGARVYVDTVQTGRTRSIVAPYSVRAVRGATVSTPLAWDEVDAKLDPRAFTIKTLPARIGELGDLWAGLLDREYKVARAVSKLASLVAPRRP